jgi:hypothetical protein
MTDIAPAAGAAADLTPLPPTMPADQAQAKIAELKANPDWVKEHLSGSHKTREEMARLHEFACQPAPGSIISGVPSLQAQRDEIANHLAATTGLSAAVIDQYRRGDPVSEDELRGAYSLKQSRMSDPDWKARYDRGDQRAHDEMWTINLIITSSLKLGA